MSDYYFEADLDDEFEPLGFDLELPEAEPRATLYSTPQEQRDHFELLEAIEKHEGEVGCVEVGGEVFFPEGETQGGYDWQTLAMAVKICDGCPVKAMCADYGIRYVDHGVWGGLRPSERKALRPRKAS